MVVIKNQLSNLFGDIAQTQTNIWLSFHLEPVIAFFKTVKIIFLQYLHQIALI